MVEVVWEGKYDSTGKKAAPLKVELPLQTIETVNESTQERQRRLERFLTGREDSEWRNRLIWGDKKYVLPALLSEFAGKVNLIYIDPPFATGADFSYTAVVPNDPNMPEDNSLTFTKQPSIIEQKAYRDTWGVTPEERQRGVTSLDRYLKWMHETIVLLRELLADNGSIFVHCDWRVNAYVRGLLDEILGTTNFHNEIVWRRSTSHSDANKYGQVHDTIYWYTKGPGYSWKPQFRPYSQEYVDRYFRFKEPDGRRYWKEDATGAGSGPARRFGEQLITPPSGRHWRWTQETIDEHWKQGRFVLTSSGKPEFKRYLDEQEGEPVSDVWDDVKRINMMADERLGYETQKPEALLERIIETSSMEKDLVLDCFVGSGTTAAVAEKLGRRWIACDLSRFAIHTTRKRLLSIQGIKPFVIQNLGKYERQAWQVAEFGNDVGQRVRSYTAFILELFSAQPLNGYIWLHGKKGNRLLHVGSVDSPISPLDVGQIVAEFKRAIGGGKEAPKTNGVDILGWDFAFELNELAKQQASQANVDLRFLRIPREVLDKKAIEQGDVHFFELASLDATTRTTGLKVTVSIRDFIIPVDDVPTDIQKEIGHWSQWIDYWAVDWDNRNDSFHNEVQEYRTRENPKLATELSRSYDKHSEYRILVKVIDILGNDTTKMLVVKV